VTRIVVDLIFAVTDMPRAAEHYTRLGFEISYHDEGLKAELESRSSDCAWHRPFWPL